MHLIRFWLGLRHRPRWGSSQRFHRLLSWILRDPTFKGKEDKETGGGTGKKRVGKRGRKKKGRTKRGRKGERNGDAAFPN